MSAKEILDELQRKNDRYNYCIKEDISFSDDDYEAHLLLDYITNLQEENKHKDKCIRKLKSHINYLDNKLSLKRDYIKELEDIEDNVLIRFLRHIKEKEILDFNYSCGENKDGSLDYNIYVKRSYKEGSDEE